VAPCGGPPKRGYRCSAAFATQRSLPAGSGDAGIQSEGRFPAPQSGNIQRMHERGAV